MIVISVMLVAALRTVGASARTEARAIEASTGRELVESLLDEVRATHYEDPGGAPQFGPEVDEPAGDRTGWDDVDDFHGWKAEPPVDRSGAVMTAMAGWSRTVRVDRVKASDVRAVEPAETGIKRVQVTAWRGDRPVARAVAFVTATSPITTEASEWAAAVGGTDAPRAMIIASSRQGPAPWSVRFDGTASSDPRGRGLAYRWTLGDGATATTATLDHEFTVAGTYTVTLQVTDEAGRVSSRAVIVVVEDA